MRAGLIRPEQAGDIRVETFDVKTRIVEADVKAVGQSVFDAHCTQIDIDTLDRDVRQLTREDEVVVAVFDAAAKGFHVDRACAVNVEVVEFRESRAIGQFGSSCGCGHAQKRGDKNITDHAGSFAQFTVARTMALRRSGIRPQHPSETAVTIRLLVVFLTRLNRCPPPLSDRGPWGCDPLTATVASVRRSSLWHRPDVGVRYGDLRVRRAAYAPLASLPRGTIRAAG